MTHRPTPSLRARALMWLAQREHTRQELHGKLARWVRAQQARSLDGEPAPGLQPGDIEPLLDALQAAGHLSDRRFVESRVNARRARFGSLRIEHELKRHGAALDETLRADLRATEADRARRVWAAKFALAPADARERARQMRFLAGRGFSPEVIRRVVDADADETFDDGPALP